MNKTKVCIITNSKNYKGGITAVVSGYHGSKLEDDFSIHYVESCSDSHLKITKAGKMLLGYIQFFFELVFFRPQIVHINSSFGFSFYRKIYYIYLGKLFKAKIVNHIHGAEFDTFFINAPDKKKRLIKKIYNKCDCVIALSDEWKGKLGRIVPTEKIKVVENYSIVHRETAKTDWNDNILFLGEVGKRKGCCDIPEVARLVRDKIPTCKFIITGNIIQNDYTDIQNQMSRYGLADCISFPGWVRGIEKEKLLSSADLFFLPSYNEGMPMSILDAMGYALPVVSTTVGGIPKIVKNQINGYTCKPGNVSEFASKIIEILQDKSKCQNYGNMSLKIIKESYSLEAHIRKIESIYNSLISS